MEYITKIETILIRHNFRPNGTCSSFEDSIRECERYIK